MAYYEVMQLHRKLHDLSIKHIYERTNYKAVLEIDCNYGFLDIVVTQYNESTHDFLEVEGLVDEMGLAIVKKFLSVEELLEALNDMGVI